MIFYSSNPYMDGPQIEDITGEDFDCAVYSASAWRNLGVDDYVIYVGF